MQRKQTAFHTLWVKGFACEADARMTVERWLAKHPQDHLEHLDILGKHHRRSGNQVYFLLRRVRQIHEIINNRRISRILKYNPELVDIVHVLGPPVEKYYSLKK